MSDLFVLRVSSSPDLYRLAVHGRDFHAGLNLKRRTVRRLIGIAAGLWS